MSREIINEDKKRSPIITIVVVFVIAFCVFYLVKNPDFIYRQVYKISQEATIVKLVYNEKLDVVEMKLEVERGRFDKSTVGTQVFIVNCGDERAKEFKVGDKFQIFRWVWDNSYIIYLSESEWISIH